MSVQEHQSWGLGSRHPRFWARRFVGVAGGSWTGREILLYRIMYRKYVQKWWLLKRNGIIWPGVAVNGQLCLEILEQMTKKVIRNFLPQKSEFSRKFLPGK